MNFLKTILLCSSMMPSLLCAQEWISMPGDKQGIVPVMRKEISIVTKKLHKATLRTSALGIYDVYINGQLINEDVLKPGWTDYRKTICYQDADVTSLLKSTRGQACISAELSDGWWSGPIARGVYGKNISKALWCRLSLEYKNGDKETFVSDTTWRSATESPLRMGDIYNGEIYDARVGTSWRYVGFDDTSWANAVINTDSKGALSEEIGPPIRIRDKKMWKHPQSVTVYCGSRPTGSTFGHINQISEKMPKVLHKGETLLIDFGQNLVGWVQFRVKGKRDTELKWKFGEMLNHNGDRNRLDNGPGGSLWTYNLRSARAQLDYTLKGGEWEEYHPRHTFYGFRYAELTATSDIEVKDIVAQVVGSDITEWGTFECSNSDINQLYRNVWWGQRGNFISIPMDCPQRDERLGWTGDTQIFATAALYNSDATEFYRKWMRDMRDSQRSDGAFPETAPYCHMWGYGCSAWGDAGIIVPWCVYVMTGDTEIIKENWESMNAWIRFCESQREGQWHYIGAEPKTGDWLAYKELEPRYVSYAYFYYSACLMERMARILSRDAEAHRYAQLAQNIRDEYQRRYITDGKINTGCETQTAYLLALRFGLLNDNQRASAIESLRHNIINNDYRLSTGFVGTALLMPTLVDVGMSDIAYRLLLQRDNPSWLYSIDQGATTVWERWDSYTHDTGFHKHEWNMNSFNHYSYGAIVEWFYSGILGINPDTEKPGFQHIILKPVFGGGLTWAKGGTQTPYGRIDVEWRQRKDGTYIYKVNIPKGTTASIYFGEETQTLTAGFHSLVVKKE